MKKLLIVTRNMAGGGCERVIAQLSAAFSDAGILVEIATEYRAPCFYTLDPRVRLFPLLDAPACCSRDIPRAYSALRRYCRRSRPDAVLAMPEKVNVWTVLALIGTGVPVIVSERNDPARHPESRIKRALRFLLYPFASGFIFQTAQARDFFPRRIRARGVVLDNPLDLSRLPEPEEGERETRIVSAGRLHTQKNFPLLVRAFSAFFAAHPGWTLTVYGDGPDRAQLESLASGLPDGAFSLPGQSKTLLADIRRAGMFVLSSDFEGMPNVLIEAMAMGLPCISTDCPCGGPRTLIADGENGLLVPVGDAPSMAEAMRRIADDPALARALGDAALHVRSRCRLDAVAAQWLAYLERASHKPKWSKED